MKTLIAALAALFVAAPLAAQGQSAADAQAQQPPTFRTGVDVITVDVGAVDVVSLAGDLIDPSTIAYSGDPETGWFGWLKDAELEAQRAAFARAMTPADRKAAAEKVQQRIVDDAAVGILGQFFEPVAYRTNVNGITGPIQFYWQMWVESPFMRTPKQPAR